MFAESLVILRALTVRNCSAPTEIAQPRRALTKLSDDTYH
jgi:hypothetical protein